MEDCEQSLMPVPGQVGGSCGGLARPQAVCLVIQASVLQKTSKMCAVCSYPEVKLQKTSKMCIGCSDSKVMLQQMSNICIGCSDPIPRAKPPWPHCGAQSLQING